MNNNWNTTVWGLCLRIVWLLIFAMGVIGALRLMGWADQPTEQPVTTPHGVHGVLKGE